VKNIKTKIVLALVVCVGLLGAASTFFSYQDERQLKMNSKTRVESVSRVASTTMKSKEDVLEIIGLGVTLDRFRQGALWDALANGNPYEVIRDMDPLHSPWGGIEKMQLAGSREEATLENAVLDTPRYWGIPVFNAAPRYQDKKTADRPEKPQGGIVSGIWDMHLFVLAHRELSERPDRVIEAIFTFFDQNPTVPFIILGTSDGDSVRADASSPAKLLDDGYYTSQMPDASAAFVIARRDRVDSLRPFVFKDIEEPQPNVEVLNRDGIARRVWLKYLALKKKVPTPPGYKTSSVHRGRTPTSAEWLAEAELFSRELSYSDPGKVNFKLTEVLNMSAKPTLSRHWQSKLWFPVPWNTQQLEQFDKLPTLGFLHRPVFVKMTDVDGKPLEHTTDRQTALQEGWKAALETLPQDQRVAGPARVIVATGGKTSQLIDFHGMLSKVAENGGPKFDPNEAKRFIDTDRRLGNTGAATFFVQTAIGVLGSYREGGVSAAFNLRDPTEASIIFISPPSDEKRKAQQHPIGGDVLRNATVPTTDPKNYEEPRP